MPSLSSNRGHFLRKFLLVFVLAAAGPSRSDAGSAGGDPAARSAPSAVAGEPAGASALETALEFLGYLGTDRDHQAKYASRLVEALVSVDRLPEAERIARAIRTNVLDSALLIIAARAGTNGDREMAERLIAECENRITAHQGAARAVVEADLAMAEASVGRVAEARRRLVEIGPHFARRDAEVRLFRVGGAAYIEKYLPEIGTEAGLSPRHKGEAYTGACEWYLDHGQPGKVGELLAEAHGFLIKEPDYLTIPLLARLGQASLAARDYGRARKVAEDALRLARTMSNLAGWKPRELFSAATLLLELGEFDRARRIAEEAYVASGKSDLTSYAEATMYACDFLLYFGPRERILPSARQVVHATRGIVHHRPRAMGVLEVLAWYLRHGLEPEPELRADFRGTAEAILKDPYFSQSDRRTEPKAD